MDSDKFKSALDFVKTEADISEVADKLGLVYSGRNIRNRGHIGLMYYAGWRKDNHPSVEVYPEMGRFIDRATMSRTGDVFELVSMMTGVPNDRGHLIELLEKIDGLRLSNARDMFDPTQRERNPRVRLRGRETGGESLYKINKVEPIYYTSLKNYLDERCISIDTANKFCRQVHYQLKYGDGSLSREHWAIGFPTGCVVDADDARKFEKTAGWEFRIEGAPKIGKAGEVVRYSEKKCSKKAATFIEGKTIDAPIHVTEGFFDFLSLAEQMRLRGKDPANETFVILNSVAMAESAIEWMKGKKLEGRRIKLYLDNDEAGRSHTEIIMKAMEGTGAIIGDFSNMFGEGEDLNKWHCRDIRRRMEEVSKEVVERNKGWVMDCLWNRRNEKLCIPIGLPNTSLKATVEIRKDGFMTRGLGMGL